MNDYFKTQIKPASDKLSLMLSTPTIEPGDVDKNGNVWDNGNVRPYDPKKDGRKVVIEDNTATVLQDIPF